jgi:hypothetical protein
MTCAHTASPIADDEPLTSATLASDAAPVDEIKHAHAGPADRVYTYARVRALSCAL